MKKLKKLNLNELKEQVTTIEAHEADCLSGGYTIEQMEWLMDRGMWSGGYVDGMGYVSGVVTAYGDDYNSSDPYNQGSIGNPGPADGESFWEIMGQFGTVVGATGYVIVTTAAGAIIPVDLGVSVVTPDDRNNTYNYYSN